jgi:hypothetical protein
MPVIRPIVVALAAVLGLSLIGAAPASAKEQRTVVTITHAPTAPTAVVGSGLATVRTYFVPIAITGRKAPTTGYMSGTLTTIATGLPDNQELRAANLVFVVGGEANQLVVGGLSLYNTDLSTIATGQTTVRPIIGGSGRYSGARGTVVTTNLGDQGWRHVFRIIR